jgi:hypothetical protein
MPIVHSFFIDVTYRIYTSPLLVAISIASSVFIEQKGTKKGTTAGLLTDVRVIHNLCVASGAGTNRVVLC